MDKEIKNKEFEPGSVCYYGEDSISVVVISYSSKSTQVCPLAGGSTFSVDPSELRPSDGSIPSQTVSAPPDSALCWKDPEDGRSRKGKKKTDKEDD